MRILAAIIALTLAPAWTDQPTGVNARLRGVSAVSDRVAWASGSGGTVLRTADGGSTWQALKVPGAEKLDFRDIDAVSEQAAYVLEHWIGRRLPHLQDRRRRAHLDAAVHQPRSKGVLRRDGVLGRRPWDRIQRFGRRAPGDPAHRQRRPRHGRACPRKACHPRSRTKARSRRAARTSLFTDAIMSGSAPVRVRWRGCCDRAMADARGRRRPHRSRLVVQPEFSRSHSVTRNTASSSAATIARRVRPWTTRRSRAMVAEPGRW